MENQRILSEKTFEKVKKKISEIKKENPEEEIVLSVDDDELARKILEKLGKEIDVFLINQKNRKDFQKQRNSGLNEIIARIAKKNNVSIGINLDEILENYGKEKSDILARISQNMNLCNKIKLNKKFISQKEKNKRDSYDLRALEIILMMK